MLTSHKVTDDLTGTVPPPHRIVGEPRAESRISVGGACERGNNEGLELGLGAWSGRGVVIGLGLGLGLGLWSAKRISIHGGGICYVMLCCVRIRVVVCQKGNDWGRDRLGLAVWSAKKGNEKR